MKYKDETIIMIEYCKDVPHSVYTEHLFFHFDLYGWDWLMYCLAGFGQNYKKGNWNWEKIIEVELNYCYPNLWKVWVDGQYILKTEVQKGVTLLKKPLMLTTYHNDKERHNNPFVVGEEVKEICWCGKCDRHYNEDGCPQHRCE